MAAYDIEPSDGYQHTQCFEYCIKSNIVMA